MTEDFLKDFFGVDVPSLKYSPSLIQLSENTIVSVLDIVALKKYSRPDGGDGGRMEYFTLLYKNKSEISLTYDEGVVFKKIMAKRISWLKENPK